MTRTEADGHLSVLPGIAHSGGRNGVVYEYANLLAQRGFVVSIVHMRMSHMRARTLRELAVGLQYFMERRRRPRWFDLDERVRVMNLSGRAMTPYHPQRRLSRHR